MMIETRIHPSIRISLYAFLLCSVVTAIRCSSDLTDSLEGRACDEKENCLPGYKCDTTRDICVAIRDSDFEDADLSAESGVDSEVEGDANRDFESSVNADGESVYDSGFDAGTDSGFDSSVDNSADAYVDAGADSSVDSGEGDSLVNTDSGDTGIQADAGTDARPCGFEIEPPGTEPPGTECPTVCDDCSDGVCFINCELEQECSGIKISCPEGFACDVACSNKQSCEDIRIDCPSVYNCNILCTAEQSCKAAKIKCGEDGPCALNCESGTQTCQDAELQCKNQSCEASCGPEQDKPEIKNCDVSCSSQCGC